MSARKIDENEAVEDALERLRRGQTVDDAFLNQCAFV